ncbi:MAG: cyclase family protein [bacterium]|nr:cyclase family protein [bacterium]
MIIDISQEIFSSQIYPGDPAPQKQKLSDISQGDAYNLSAFSMCSHNGTHIDAPSHFLPQGATIDQLSPDIFVGPAYVATYEGEIGAGEAQGILEQAAQAGRRCAERLLLRGRSLVTAEAARIFANAKLKLIGCELLSFGPEETPAEVHIILLSAGVILLEGLRLQHVQDGAYLLSAMPLNLGGCEGAPCRAVLLS